MDFKCLYCGKLIETYNVTRIRVFCSRQCTDAVARTKAFSKDEIALERARRVDAYRSRTKQEPHGLHVKCVVCGKDMVQVSSSPKLFCSQECCSAQSHQHYLTRDEIQQEKERRKQAFLDTLTPEHKQHLDYNKKKRLEFGDRMARSNPDGTLQPTRHCHNYFTKVHCPNLTWDYYCPECRRAKRQGYVEEDYNETESIFDDFSIPAEALHDGN